MGKTIKVEGVDVEIVSHLTPSCVVVERTREDGSTERFNAWSPNPGTYDEIWYQAPDYIGYVQADTTGDYFIQLPADNQWGFTLCSDDQAFPGSFGAAPNGTRFIPVAREDVPPEVEEELGWILDES